MPIISYGPGLEPPDNSDEQQLRQQLADSIGGDGRTALERHTAGVAASQAAGGFTDFDEYTEALQLKRLGKADAATLRKIENTSPGIEALANRPG